MTGLPVRPAQMVLRTMPHPDGSSRRIWIYEDWLSACTHLQRHLLTAPECQAWALVIPCLEEIVPLDDTDGRWRYYRRFLDTNGVEGQALYDRYCGAVENAGEDATRLAWHVTSGRATVALGTSGVLMVIESSLKTAFLPGQGDPSIVDSCRGQDQPRHDRRDPRTRGMRSGRTIGRGTSAGDSGDGHDRGSLKWTETQKLYYGAFRPAVQFVRSRYYLDLDVRGQRRLGEYGLLKDVLPPMSCLKYEHWMTLREKGRQP
jgi:hypothetical protein